MARNENVFEGKMRAEWDMGRVLKLDGDARAKLRGLGSKSRALVDEKGGRG
jgi:hypothetical protein